MEKSKVKILLFLLLLCLSFIMIGCTKNTKGKNSEANIDTKEETKQDSISKVSETIIKIGLVAPITGTNKRVGEYMVNGARLAQEEINKAGGILGKQIELVFGDEGNKLQDSLDVTRMLLSDTDISAIIGSMYSNYCMEVLPNIAQAKIPFLASGSASSISEEKNPYTWQIRPIDTYQGTAMAEFAIDTLHITNPAILYSNQSTFLSFYTQVKKAFEAKGVIITKDNLFCIPEEEIDYTPYFLEILEKGFDGVIALTNQLPAVLVCQGAERAGVDRDKIPCIGSTSFCSKICINNAEKAAEGWYSVADWVSDETEFEKAYIEQYKSEPDLPAVICYDSLYLIKEACEIAESTACEEINQAFEKIENFQGVLLKNASYHENHVFSGEFSITRNQNKKAELVKKVSIVQP